MPKLKGETTKAKQELAQALESYTPIEECKPGIYTGVKFEDYCKIQAVNRSRLSRAKQSLLHYATDKVQDDNPALAFGSLCHHGKLEPEELISRYVVLPDFHKFPENTTKDGKPSESKGTEFYKQSVIQFMEKHKGKQEVSSDWMKQLEGMLTALTHHVKAAALFKQGVPEVTIVWIDPATKLKCKARIDWLVGAKPGMTQFELAKAATAMADLKTTEDVIKFKLEDYDYHVQAAMYLEGWKVLTGKILPFHFIACEKKSPNAVRSAPIGSNALSTGRVEFLYLMQLVAKANEAKAFPGPNDPESWELSPWYKQLWFRDHVQQTVPTVKKRGT